MCLEFADLGVHLVFLSRFAGDDVVVRAECGLEAADLCFGRVLLICFVVSFAPEVLLR
jgi:hypothetical protein